MIPLCDHLSEIPLKFFFALGNIWPEPFAERSVVVFKPCAIPHEVIHAEDGVRWGTLIGPFSSIQPLIRPAVMRFGMKSLRGPAAHDPRPRRAGLPPRCVAS